MTSWGRGLVPLATIFFGGGGAVQTQEKGKERKMMAIQPNRCPREEAGKEDDPVKEVIRLVVQTWFRE